nr:hypothetical protein BCU15_04420 [Vibrio cyclitrophicus]
MNSVEMSSKPENMLSSLFKLMLILQELVERQTTHIYRGVRTGPATTKGPDQVNVTIRYVGTNSKLSY